uniref:Uncharacterized protein n=1 Tax=Panagrolaimus davidi TaxID=227884 RepID=A0A914PF92_9BILA
MKNYLRRFRNYLSESGPHPDDEDYPGSDLEASRRSDRLTGRSGGGGISKKKKSSTIKKKKKSTATGIDGDGGDEDGQSSSVFESSEEESSTARLSRRSSVLVDLFALFRRSSSFGRRTSGRYSSRGMYGDQNKVHIRDLRLRISLN